MMLYSSRNMTVAGHNIPRDHLLLSSNTPAFRASPSVEGIVTPTGVYKIGVRDLSRVNSPSKQHIMIILSYDEARKQEKKERK